MSSVIHRATFILVIWTLNVHGDQWAPVKSFEKQFYNGLITVSVRTSLMEGTSPTAKIVKKEKSIPLKLCSGDLVNKRRPVEVFVSGDGKTLVTVDEWEHAGYEHSIVFYRCDKRLIKKKDYSLGDFLNASEITENASMSISSRDWSRNAEFRMQKDDFTIKLKSGRKITFSLLDGTILDEKKTKTKSNP